MGRQLTRFVETSNTQATPSRPWTRTCGTPLENPSSRTAGSALFANKKFALTFIHFREPDTAGHSKGWMSEPYLKAVKVSDDAIGVIVKAIKDAGLWEKTALIISADHGGKDRDHHLDIPDNRTIPWICVGPGVKAGLVIEKAVRTYDTAPTALSFLGIAPPAEIDGKTVEAVAAVRAK